MHPTATNAPTPPVAGSDQGAGPVRQRAGNRRTPPAHGSPAPSTVAHNRSAAESRVPETGWPRPARARVSGVTNTMAQEQLVDTTSAAANSTPTAVP
ncbi:hypothetical protein [Nocardiopsis quinghaiensis]|uniref:hypothetical protein n=1 Tax=Nocardiopsis quinghaiensis TaxID=464995 RepID=UPI00168194B2|nr:hypothetical protein [Nocardiopsis quinghaiensis]